MEKTKMARSLRLRLEIETLSDDGRPISARIRAVKAAGNLIRGVDDDDRLEMLHHVTDYLKGLISVARESTSSEDVHLVLGHINEAFNLSRVLSDHATYTYLSLVPPFTTKICELTIRALIKFRNESRVVVLCSSLFGQICGTPEFSEECLHQILLASGLIPTLAIIMMTHSTHKAIGKTEEEEKELLVQTALEILDKVLCCCTDDASLISNILQETALPVFHSILNSTSRWIISGGSWVIGKFLLTVGKETIGLKFVGGKTGLEYILQIMAHILHLSNEDVELAEYAMDIIRDLHSVVGENCDLGKGLDEVSTAALITMRNYDVDTCTDVLLIFSYLIIIQCDAVLNFLSKPAGSIGQNSLRFVIVGGLCEKYKWFDGLHRGTVKLALTKIVEYGVAHPEFQLLGESLEAVRALLLSPDVDDVEELDG